MKKSWVIAILFGLVAASGSAKAVVITPVSVVLNAQATSGGGTVTADPVIVGAIYGQFSNSAESRGERIIGDFARASILTNIQPDELRLSGTAGASSLIGGPYAGASALVEFEVSTSSEWLLSYSGYEWPNFYALSGSISLMDSDGAVFSFSCGWPQDCTYALIWANKIPLSLDRDSYYLSLSLGTGSFTMGMSGGRIDVTLRPIPNAVPIPASFGTLGPDLLMFGVICVFGVLRPAWHRTRGTQPRVRAAHVAPPAGWVGHRQQ